MFICVVGMDGTGKTTLTRGLVGALRERGVAVEYVYGRFQPMLTRPILSILGKTFLGARSDYSAYAGRRRRILTNPALYWSYQVILAIDYLLQVAWRIRRPLRRGNGLICDRYYVDTVVADIAIDTKVPEQTASRLISLYRRLLPEPDLILMTDVPAEVAFARKTDIPSLEYAEELRSLYQHAARYVGAQTLDGTKPANVLLRSVLARPELSQVAYV